MYLVYRTIHAGRCIICLFPAVPLVPHVSWYHLVEAEMGYAHKREMLNIVDVHTSQTADY